MLEPCRSREPIVSESVLLERAARGDGIAFSELVSRHYPRAIAIAYGLLKHDDRVDAVVQDAFVRIAKRLHALPTPHTFTVVFYRLLFQLCLHDMHHKHSPLRMPPPWYVGYDKSPTEVELAEHTVRRALTHCTAPQQMMYLLAELGGFDDALIGAILRQTPEWIAHNLLQIQPQEPIRHAIAVVIGKPNALLALREIRRQITRTQRRRAWHHAYHGVRDIWIFHRAAMRRAGMGALLGLACLGWIMAISAPRAKPTPHHSAMQPTPSSIPATNNACFPDTVDP